MDRDDNFNEILKTRRVPCAPAGLSTWIIAEAQDMRQERTHGRRVFGFARLWDDLQNELFSGFSLPQPALAMAMMLVVGFSLGIYGEAFDVLWGAVPGLTTDDLSGFMVIGDSFVAAEF